MADRPVEPPRRDESQVAEEAARWFEALKTAGHEQHAQFTAWLRQSSRHVHYFLHTTALEGLLDHADPRREFDIQELVREARRNVIALDTSAPHATRRPQAARTRRRVLLTSAAGSAAAVLAAAAWLTAAHPWGWTAFTTRTGEQRAVELADGSIAHLNTGSRLQVRLTEQARDIRLVEGEALFIVHRDAHRPFSVHVDDSVIQAVGTQFNVYRRIRDTKVSVLEGKVEVSAGGADESIPAPIALSAGEEAQIQSDGQVRRRHAADVAQATAWRQRRLVFRADPLSEVVTEFNRYNRSPRIRLEDWDGAPRHYTGTFNADDPEAFAAVLSEEHALAVERTGNEIIIRPRLADSD